MDVLGAGRGEPDGHVLAKGEDVRGIFLAASALAEPRRAQQLWGHCVTEALPQTVKATIIRPQK